MASIVGALDAMEADGIVDNARTIGTDVLAPGLAELAAKHPTIGEVRGVGVFWALDLVSSPETREPLSGGVMLELKAALMKRGLLPFTADNRIHVVPPCIITADEVAQALAIYDEVLTEYEAGL
jgi:taurine--2-oxoglutarate transaminase